jgi:hypothetical protein
MKWSPEIGEKIVSAINEKAPHVVCAVCGMDEFSLSDGFVVVTLQEDTKTVKLAGRGLPSAAIVCVNCGNTYLLNLIMLGVLEKEGGKEKEEEVVK